MGLMGMNLHFYKCVCLLFCPVTTSIHENLRHLLFFVFFCYFDNLLFCDIKIIILIIKMFLSAMTPTLHYCGNYNFLMLSFPRQR